MSWKRAFLKQALSDYDIFKEFNQKRKPLCHQLHYFQMATEKLSKGYLAGNNNQPPKHTHAALVRFLQGTKSSPAIRVALGYSNNKRAYAQYIDDLTHIAKVVQDLAPVGGKNITPNPEYPWKDVQTGKIICPLEYSFPSLKWRSPQMVKLRELIHTIIKTEIGNNDR